MKLASHRSCTGCMACLDSCGHSAIKLIKDNELFYPIVEKDKCVKCKLCENSCPVVSPIHKNIIQDTSVYGGWSIDKDIRSEGASGGVFIGLAKSFLRLHKENASVYGARLLNNRVHHDRVTQEDNLRLFINSKYIQSETQGVYKKIRKDLNDGLFVLFSGTPCQVAGLYGFLGKKRDDDHLLTIELICAGVLSPEALDIHLKSNNSSEIVSFRSKVNGGNYGRSQCTTIYKNGQIVRFNNRKEDVFYRCFSSSLLERTSCFSCKFSSLNRVGDITIGDFWGGENLFKDFDKGVNVILTNNHKAMTFVTTSKDVEISKCTLGDAIRVNSNLYTNYSFIQFHPLALWPKLCRRIIPRKTWLHIVKNDNPWRLVWGVYRLIGKFYNRFFYIYIKIKYSQLLN